MRSVDRIGELRAEDSARAWFYRSLRNAVTDHYRRVQATNRRLEDIAVTLNPDGVTDPEIEEVICACIGRIAELLKPEYAEALRRVEVEGIPVVQFARDAGISESNAGVRVLRARAALPREVARSCRTCTEHGCFDCACS